MILKLLRPETVVTKFFFPLFLTSITIYLSFRDLILVSLASFPSAFPYGSSVSAFFSASFFYFACSIISGLKSG